jgi:hypothetical protein
MLEALRRADLVLLLLTANFIASNYCIDEKLGFAREREKIGTPASAPGPVRYRRRR